MNAPLDPTLRQAHELAAAIAQACDRIAPTWPLDRFIAVNPYWGWVRQPVAQAAAHLGVLAGSPLTVPRSELRRHWRDGRLQPRHLEAVSRRHGGEPSASALQAALADETPPPPRLPLVSDLCDAALAPAPMRWSEIVTHQVSQHCAAWFDNGQSRWPTDRAGGLYASWKRQLAADRGLAWPGGRRATLARIAALPDDPLQAMAQALDLLVLAPAARVPYLTAVLMAIQGWAAWCAYERWQARLDGGDDDHLPQLLAIRLGWEVLLAQGVPAAGTPLPLARWAQGWAGVDAQAAALAARQRTDWLLQEALELADQAPLCAALATLRPAPVAATPQVQAVFCIDVRSEVLRRALEAADPGVRTRGFAGFFGLPIAYRPAGSALTRPQLPGLLSPAMTATESAASGGDAPALGAGRPLADVLAARRQQALQWRQRWADLRGAPASGFSLVETCGLAYGVRLLADSLPGQQPPARWEDTGLPADAQGACPRLPMVAADVPAAAALARDVLHAMGLPDRHEGFAPLVLLAGHGSQSANNPHAAGLDCGACGGQTGEVNARVLANLLNAPAVRAELAALGTPIPPGTHFVPALHNTTTDDVVLHDTDAVPPSHAGALARLRESLAEAGRRARAERAAGLGLSDLAARPEALAGAVRRRANDWAEVRPEWGLADCVAFIVAPRRRTAGLALHGRAFLHDYDHRQDPDLGLLTLIMTAPMVVTNWINLQYHASSVDPRRFGSGNKVLHNVVGGHLGVFEGNGGDLRIGLAWQSVHDGHRLRHTPLRLAVYIEAPREALQTVIERHAVVRDLVDHGWLHLLRIDPDGAGIEQRRGGAWMPVEALPAA